MKTYFDDAPFYSSRAFQRYQKCGEGHRGGLGDLNMTIELPSLIDRCLQNLVF